MEEASDRAADPRQLSLVSPAKVNIFFHILGVREDGFREISSLYQAVDLQDTLTVSVSEKDSFSCSDPALASEPGNLVLLALDLFRQKTGLSDCFSIHLEKNIPIMAGLGGGSSNAATALWAFTCLTRSPLSPSDLMVWGAELGSDVPFFFSSGSALVSGRGEVVVDADPLVSDPFWIVKPPFGLSTVSVYRAHKHGSGGKEGLSNDLEEPAFSLAPSLADLKRSLLEFGFETVLLSGSGTSFVCLNPRSGADPTTLRRDGLQIFPVKPLQRKPSGWYE